MKDKLVAGLLALFLGGWGIHMFYLNKTTAGVLMLLFCWTGIPAIIAFIQGILILVSSDEEFQRKYCIATTKTTTPKTEEIEEEETV